MSNVFLLLGSNLGDRETNIKDAVTMIANEISPVVTRSSMYETQSWGVEGQPDYLNQVLMISTDKPAQQVLKTVLQIENTLGRERIEKWGSRTIDIDILFYGDEVIDEPNLVVPHPQLHKRGFTLAPLAEIAPQLLHPILKKTTLELKFDLIDTLNIKKL